MNFDAGCSDPKSPDSYNCAFLKTDVKVSNSAADVKSTRMKYKKAPDAPKRFKSAFIFFSSEKHKVIRSQMEADGVATQTATIAKLVSEAWKNLPPDEKEKWEVMARRDRARYEMEKTTYKGPWKVPAKKRSLKDPNAPKRPMSAYLAFSNSRRAEVKRQNPDMGNAELSRLLSTMWKEAPADVRQKYIDKEFAKRQAYNATMATWKRNSQEEKRAKRELREEVALRAVEASEQIVGEGIGDAVVCHASASIESSRHNSSGSFPAEHSSFNNVSVLSLWNQMASQSTSGATYANPLAQRREWGHSPFFQP